MGETSHVTYHIHNLEEVNEAEPFECNQCEVKGSGVRYKCKPCNFNLHLYCATCPSVLTSSVHEHELNLLDAVTMPYSYCCNKCGDKIQGIFYHCTKYHDFSAHPLCVAPQPSPTPEPPQTVPMPPPVAPMSRPLSRSIPWHQPYSPSHVSMGAPYYHPTAYPYSPNYTPDHVTYGAHHGVSYGQVTNNNMSNMGNHQPHSNYNYHDEQGNNNNSRLSRRRRALRFMQVVAAGALGNVIGDSVSNMIT